MLVEKLEHSKGLSFPFDEPIPLSPSGYRRPPRVPPLIRIAGPDDELLFGYGEFLPGEEEAKEEILTRPSTPIRELTLAEIARPSPNISEAEWLTAGVKIRLEVKEALYNTALILAEEETRLGGILKGRKLIGVDVGIWTADYPEALFTSLHHLYGIDTDNHTLQNAKARNPGSKFSTHLVNVLELPSGDDARFWRFGRPNVAFFIGVADCLTPDEVACALQNMKGTVGPGGLIFVGVQNQDGPEIWQAIFQSLLQENPPQSNSESLLDLMLKAGLHVRQGGLYCEEKVHWEGSAREVAPRSGMAIPFVLERRDSTLVPFLSRPLGSGRRPGQTIQEEKKRVTRDYRYCYDGEKISSVPFLLYEGIVPNAS